jgi:hypothetical protein
LNKDRGGVADADTFGRDIIRELQRERDFIKLKRHIWSGPAIQEAIGSEVVVKWIFVVESVFVMIRNDITEKYGV